MTRWNQEFDQHPFKAIWAMLLGAIEPLEVDDKTVTTTVEELARLKKVIAFIDSIIASADMELTPKNVWANCQSQADACLAQIRLYDGTRNVVHLVQANEHADNLLTYVRPYMVFPQQSLKALGNAEGAFSRQIMQYVESFQARTSTVQANLESAVNGAVIQLERIEAIELRAKQFDEYLFVGTEESKPAEAYVKEMVSGIEVNLKEVEDLHKTLFEGPDSTSERVMTYANSIDKMHHDLEQILNAATARDNDIDKFYGQIFGSQAGDDKEVGLKRELELRLEHLGEHETAQKSRQEALFKSIESLLPGATSAGLASAYKALKDKFDSPIIGYTIAFYASMLVLFFGGFVLVIDSFTLSPLQQLHIEFVKTNGWEEMIRTLLTRAPIVLPVIWVAIFSATRRSQYERLQQEYAHKEAFASSYESYKKQLEALQDNSDILKKELIAKAIEAIAFNASQTLDGKHTEKLPIHQLLEKLNLDELKKLLDLKKD